MRNLKFRPTPPGRPAGRPPWQTKVDYRLAHMVKQASSGKKNGLPAFLPETWLLESKNNEECKINAGLFDKYTRFRDAVNLMIKREAAESGKDLVRSFTNMLSTFSAMDRTCMIELKWLTAMTKETP